MASYGASWTPKLAAQHRHIRWGCGCQNRFGIPFWLAGAPHLRTYFSGDWDVHWGYDLDFDPWPQNERGKEVRQCLELLSLQTIVLKACAARQFVQTLDHFRNWMTTEKVARRYSGHCHTTSLLFADVFSTQSGKIERGLRIGVHPCANGQFVCEAPWLKIKQEGLRRFWSMFPIDRVPFWYRLFEPQPFVRTHFGALN